MIRYVIPAQAGIQYSPGFVISAWEKVVTRRFMILYAFPLSPLCQQGIDCPVRVCKLDLWPMRFLYHPSAGDSPCASPGDSPWLSADSSSWM